MRCYARPVPPDNNDATGGLWRNMADDVGNITENLKRAASLWTPPSIRIDASRDVAVNAPGC